MFTPISATLGGISIGVAAALLLLFHGRIAGISGIVGGGLTASGDNRAWRLWFLGGLVGGGVLLGSMNPAAYPSSLPHGPFTLVAAGLLVGFGTRLGNGCTSGHGVCGLGRGSIRSLAATLTFMLLGAVTVYLARTLVGSAP